MEKPPHRHQHVQCLSQICFLFVRIVGDYIGVERDMKVLAGMHGPEKLAVIHPIKDLRIDPLAPRLQSQTAVDEPRVFEYFEVLFDAAAGVDEGFKGETDLFPIQQREFLQPLKVHAENFVPELDSTQVESSLGIDQLRHHILRRAAAQEFFAVVHLFEERFATVAALVRAAARAHRLVHPRHPVVDVRAIFDELIVLDEILLLRRVVTPRIGIYVLSDRGLGVTEHATVAQVCDIADIVQAAPFIYPLRDFKDGLVPLADAGIVAQREALQGIDGGIIAAPDDRRLEMLFDMERDLAVLGPQGGVYGHPDHVRINFFQHTAQQFQLTSTYMGVCGPFEDLPLLVDPHPRVFAFFKLKLVAPGCHRALEENDVTVMPVLFQVGRHQPQPVGVAIEERDEDNVCQDVPPSKYVRTRFM